MTELEVRGLTKTFGPVTAVRDVSFTAPAGAVNGLLGYAAVFAAAAAVTTLRRDVT